MFDSFLEINRKREEFVGKGKPFEYANGRA